MHVETVVSPSQPSKANHTSDPSSPQGAGPSELAALVQLPEAADGGETAPTVRIREQTLSALLNLGYPKAQAERALAGAENEAGPDATLEALVRVSLRRLAR